MERIKLVLALLVLLLVVSACGNSGGAAQPTAATGGDTNAQATQAPAAQPTAAEPATAQPTAATQAAAGDDLQVDKSKLSPELHLFNWADYISPDVLESFEQEYGVKAIVDVFDSNEDMIGKVGTSNQGYDIVFPSDYAVDIMVRQNLLEPLDKALLPNLKNMKKDLLDLYYDKGNVHSMPYNTGTTGLGYDASQFPTPPDSWATVFDAQQVATRNGEFSMLDDPREVPGAALRYMGKSLNDTDPANLSKVEELLKAQKSFMNAKGKTALARYDSSSVGRGLAGGTIEIGQIYNNNALQARTGLQGSDGYPGNPNIRFFIPKEGATIWQDNMCILASSSNKYTAHVFINYMMRPDVAAKNEEFVLGVTPNAEAEKLLPADLQALFKEGFAPDAETLKRLEWIERNDQTVAFEDLWTAVKGQ